jgi:hypothetical protein
MAIRLQDLLTWKSSFFHSRSLPLLNGGFLALALGLPGGAVQAQQSANQGRGTIQQPSAVPRADDFEDPDFSNPSVPGERPELPPNPNEPGTGPGTGEEFEDPRFCPPGARAAGLAAGPTLTLGNTTYARSATTGDWVPVDGAAVRSFGSAAYAASGGLFSQRRFGQDRLPGVDDPNSIMYRSTQDRTSLDVSTRPAIQALGWSALTEDAGGPDLGWNVELRPTLFYDTGYNGRTVPFRPDLIAVDGSADAHRRGQLTFDNFNDSASVVRLPAKVEFDSQIKDFADLGDGQAYFDLYSPQSDSLALRHGYLRFDAAGSTTFLVGKAPTLFGDMGGSPVTIDSGSVPLGFVSVWSNGGDYQGSFQGIPQIRVDQDLWERTVRVGLSIEDQGSLDDVYKAGDALLLTRFPVFISRVRWSPTDFSSLQLAGLYRRFTIDSDITYADNYANGYGVNLMGRWRSPSKSNALFGGVAAGQGLGHYLYGGSSAAIILADDDIRALGQVGAYVGLEHVWYANDDGSRLLSTAAYGYLASETVVEDESRRVQHAWANLLWDRARFYAVGFEYQYGWRETVARSTGNDHRLGLVVQINLGANAAKATQSDAQARAFTEGTGPVAEQLSRDHRRRL